jgi:carboxyl-terminal processing protease
MDYRGRRLRTILLLSTAFLGGVAIGPASGLIASHLVLSLSINSAFPQDINQTNTYRLLLFGDAFEKVRSEYVDPVPDKELMEHAINGMLTGLDPHSAYMNAKEFHEIQMETTGEFGGLGIEVVPENGFFKVISPMDDTPAFKAGIKAGDIITGLNG